MILWTFQVYANNCSSRGSTVMFDISKSLTTLSRDLSSHGKLTFAQHNILADNFATYFVYNGLLHFISPYGRFSENCTISFRVKYSIFSSSLSSSFHSLSLCASTFHSLYIYPFHLPLSLSPSLYLSFYISLSLLLSLFSLSFSLAYLMDVFVLVFFYYNLMNIVAALPAHRCWAKCNSTHYRDVLLRGDFYAMIPIVGF